MNDVQALDLLEKRLLRLEQQIIGNGNTNEIDLAKVKPVLNTLHEVDTVLISGISGREKINTLLKKIDLLHKILDPSFLDSINDVDAKSEVVLESEKVLRDFVNNLNHLEKAQSILNDENAEQFPNLSDRINMLMSKVLRDKEECDRQTAETIAIVNSYKNCITHISLLLVQLDAAITHIEIESQPKTTPD